MGYVLPPELDRLMRDTMASGGYASEDEVLRDALRTLAERDQAVALIEAGVADLEAGRVRPLAEADANLRRKHDIPRGA